MKKHTYIPKTTDTIIKDHRTGKWIDSITGKEIKMRKISVLSLMKKHWDKMAKDLIYQYEKTTQEHSSKNRKR